MEQQSNLFFDNPEIRLEELPSAAHVDWNPLQRSYLNVHLIQFSLLMLILAVSFMVYSYTAHEKFPETLRWIILGALGAFLLFGILIRVLGFKIKGYAIRKHDMMYRSGLLFRRTVVLPYNRIQHSEIHQNFIERQFGLARLELFTAGGASSDLSIPGLLRENAEQMRTFLTEKTDQEEEEE